MTTLQINSIKDRETWLKVYQDLGSVAKAARRCGIARSTLNRWIFAKKLLLFFSLSLLIEALQYMLRIGAFDVTDLINNTVGAVMGLMLFQGIDKAYNNSDKAQKLINLLAAATLIMIVLLVFLKMNMLPIRYQ